MLMLSDKTGHFDRVSIPIKRSTYGPLQPKVAGINEMYIQSKDVLVPGLTWIVSTTDRGRSWDTVMVNGDAFFHGDYEPILLAREALLVLGMPNELGGLGLFVSTDYGSSWHDTIGFNVSDVEFNAMNEFTGLPPCDYSSPQTAYILDTNGATESDDGGRTWHRAPVPPTTAWYRYFGESNILSQRWTSESGLRLFRSIDRGTSWIVIDTMRFVNHDTTIVPATLHEVRRDGNNLSATFRYRSGEIVSTTDAGETWIYRGRTQPDDEFDDVEKEMSTLSGQGTIIPQKGDHFIVLPEGSADPLYHVSNVPAGIPLQLGDSVYLIGTGSSLFKSIDDGVTWFILDSEIAGFHGVARPRDADIQPFEAQKLWIGRKGQLHGRAQYEEIRYNVGGTSRSNSTHFLALRQIGDEVKWCYAGFTLDNPYLPISESNHFQPAIGQSSPILVNFVVNDVAFPSKFIVQTDSGQPLHATTRKRIHFAWQVRSGEVLLMADSLLISADTGLTWRALPSLGLPLDSAENIATVTSFCEGPNGEWYMGLSGSVIMSAEEETGREPGGVVRSRDRGLTWQRLSGFPEPTHVFHVACDGAGVVYASTTQRTYGVDRPSGRKEQDHMSQVFRISGDTAELSFSEYLSGPPTKAGRVLRRDQRGAMLYATMYEGLKRSTDGGLSWHQVGNDALDTMTIKDVVVARDNRLYVGTTIGVYESNALTSGIEQEEDASRRTTVWCYPTPAATSLRIRLNNMDLVIGTAPKLILCTIKGEEVLNFSEDVRRSLGSKRTEFDADVSNLTPGIYALVLQVGKSSAFHKVLIIH
ncbi:MAG: hypothetical protein ACK6C4_05215 [Bacteroidota bacterium]